MLLNSMEMQDTQSPAQSHQALWPAVGRLERQPLGKQPGDSGYEIAGHPISYPESSGFLVSGWAPVETLGNSKKFKFFDWLPCNDFHCFTAEILR